MSSRSRRVPRPIEEGRVMRPAEPLPVVTEIEVVAEAVVSEVEGVQPDPTTAELALLTEEGWQIPDRLFWETVEQIGPPKLRHRIDMVMTRGSGDDMKTRVVTVYDAVTD
jgi:hypothetical protein